MEDFRSANEFFTKLAQSSQGEKMEFLYMGLAYISRGLEDLAKEVEELKKKSASK